MNENIKVCIINSSNRYELARTNRILLGMQIEEAQVITIDKFLKLNQVTEDYIAFYNTFDTWSIDKVTQCETMIGGKYDIIVHSYIQHYGRKQYKHIFTSAAEDEQSIIEEVLVKGFPGISSIVCRRDWLLQLKEMLGHDIEITSKEFVELLETKLVEGNCRVGVVSDILSESWSKIDNNNYSIKDAKEYILAHWKKYKNEIKARSLYKQCYDLFKSCFETEDVCILFETLEMGRQDIIDFYEEQRQEDRQQLIRQAENTDRKNDFYLFMRCWVELHQDGKTIADVLKEQNVRRIAIYGAGKHGQMLANELRDSQIEVVCWIDRSTEEKELLGYPVYTVESIFPDVDALIVTPYREFDVIQNVLRDKTTAKIISLAKLVGR